MIRFSEKLRKYESNMLNRRRNRYLVYTIIHNDYIVNLTDVRRPKKSFFINVD